MLRELLTSGASVSYEFHNKATPLHKAAEFGSSSCVSVLLGQGADIEARNEYSFTPLHIASRNGKAAAAEVLLNA